MNRIFKSLIICSVLLTAAAGCSDMFREEIYDIHEELDKINARLDELSKELNTNVNSLQTIIEALQQKDYVDKITPIMDGGVEIGYEIIFTQSGSVKIYHGEKGDEGHSPVVGMKQEQDGRWYWTIDGEWMLDDNKNKVLAIAEDGKDGLTPKFEVRDGDWYITYDDGETWKYYAQATGDKGDKGDKGDSMFSSVDYNDQFITLVLADGVTSIKLPTWASHQLLVDEIARINNNIDALQKAVAALEKNDYVTKVTPIEGEDGAVLGYVLSFAFTGDVSIYHGKDGEDGHNPIVGAKQDTDGNWYWTVDDQWLLDENGAKIRTTGDDGLTPKFKIEDGQWFIRYNDEEEWKEYGQATGDKGEQGETGNAGDSIFAKDGIDVSNPNYIELTLANGTKIQIPTLASVLALENFVNQLNENIISLQTIVTGLQNNDYVTSVSDIIDPQTNEKIGYTLHFSKSGNVDIYHGEDGKDGEAGKDGVTPTVTISEDGYWVINGVKQSVKAVGIDGIDGTTPKFKIVDGKWMVSYDNGGSWTEAGQATGDQGPEGPQGPQGPEGVGGTAGDTLFKSITEEYATDEKGNVITDFLGKPTVAYIVITLNDNDEDDTNNPVYKIPTDYVIGDLQKQIDAITNDIKTIQTVLNAVQNAEYIKECTPLYDGLVHVGYEIVFAKFTVENGEQTRKTTIYNGTDGVNGTVIGALYDETTQTWYWTIDDQPLKDANGNLVPLQGKDGVNGVTPQMNINATTNFWEVSYDGGKTWESTGVKATGPQGENGSAGSSAESYIQDVKEEGDYYVFYVKDGSTITVPTAKAFETLAKKVAALEESSASISSILGVLNGMKFVKSSERFENETGSGYKLVLVTFDPATMAQTEETCYVYDGKDGAAGAAGADGKTPVVGLRQDADGDYYWTLDGADILVDGKPVKANGADGQPGAAGAAGPVPTFRIDTDGYLWVKVGDAEEQNLGKVVGAAGSAGAAGSNASIEVTEEENGKIVITFKNDGQSTGSISVPSWNAFLELQAQVNTMNGNITALQSSVDALLGHDCVIAVVEDKKDGEVVGYTLTFAKSGDKYISLGKDGADGQPGAPGTDGKTPVIGVAAEDGVLYWTVDMEWLKDEAGNKVPVTGAKGEDGQQGVDGKTPKFKIVDGDWYYSYDKENTTDNDIEGWTYAGRATGSAGEAGGAGDSFFSGITAVGADQVTVVGAAEAYYIKMELVDGSSYLIPTQKTTDAINSLITSANSNIEALQTAVAALENNDYVTKVEQIEGGYKIYFSKGTEAVIYHGAKGEQGDKGADGVTPTVSINEQGYWVINGEVTEVKAAGDKGNDGVTPEFKIDSYTDSEGNVYTAYWFVKYGENAEWQPLHQALGPQGPQGPQGEQGPVGPEGPQGAAGVTGDAFIHSITPLGKDGETVEGVTFANAWYIRIILNDTTETLEDNPTYIIPTKKVSDELYGLVEKLNENVESLSTIVNALDARQYLISYGPYQDAETGKTGYRLTLSDGDDEGNEDDVIYIWHGTNGENGSTPSVSVKADEDGKLYWTVNGEWLLDGENKVPATGDKGEQGEQGNPGIDGKTPEFKIGSCEYESLTYTECWLVSFDQGQTWNPVLGADGKPFGAKGETGGQGDSFFQSVTTEEVDGHITYLVLTIDGVQHKIPTKYTFDLLEARVSALENSIEALQTLVDALTGRVDKVEGDIAALNSMVYVTGIEYYKNGQLTQNGADADSYKILFSNETSITVTNGKDGSTPQIGVQKHTDGLYYWTVGGEWLKDADGNMVRAQGVDGQDAVAPQVRINQDTMMWEISVDGGLSWTSTGVKAEGVDGDSIFAKDGLSVSEDGLYITLTLADGTTQYQLLTAKAYEAIEGAQTDISSLQTLVDALTGRVDKVEGDIAALNSMVYVTGIEYYKNGQLTQNGADADSYKILFSNETSITVTNGKDGSTPHIGVQKHEDGLYYWTVDGEWLKDADNNMVRAQGVDGKDAVAPQVRINSETMMWEISVDGGKTWDSTGVKAEGKDGADGDSIFAKDGLSVSEDGLYITLTLADGTTQYQLLTAKAYEAIEGAQTNITSLQNLVATLTEKVGNIEGEINTLKSMVYVSGIEYYKNGQQVSSSADADSYKILFSNNTSITVTNGKDGSTPHIGVQKHTDDLYYWTVGGEWLKDADGNMVRAQGVDGQDAVAPQVQINPETKMWEISVDGGLTWTSTNVVAVGKDGENGSVGADGKDGAVNVVFTNDPSTYNAETETATAATALWVGVQYGENASDIIWMPTYTNFQLLSDRVKTLEETIEGLQPLLSGETFITGITPHKDAAGNVTGISYTSKTVDASGNLVTNTGSNYVDLSGLVVPGTDGFKVITGYNQDGTPIYSETMAWSHNHSHTPEISVDADGNITIKVDGVSSTVELPKATDTYGKIAEEIKEGDVLIGYKLAFPDSTADDGYAYVEVPVYMPNPVINFYTNAAMTSGSQINEATGKNLVREVGASGKTVYFKIIGSFVSAPKLVIANCEGNWLSTVSYDNTQEVNIGTNNSVAGSVTVKPTTAYTDDETEGKLTLYVPYYGAMGIGQFSLTADQGEIQVKSYDASVAKAGDDTEVTITLSEYLDETKNSVIKGVENLTIKTNDFAGATDDQVWLSMGDFSYTQDNTSTKDVDEGELVQKLQLTPYIISPSQLASTDYNYQHVPRECTIAVYTPSGREAGRYLIQQSPVVDLASDPAGSANCYIISTPGRYRIPACMGNDRTKKITDVSGGANEIWSDAGNTVTNFKVEGDYITFDVTGTVENGNTIIGVKNQYGQYEWSWHLWFITSDSRPDDAAKWHRYPTSGAKVMDRSLGAKTQDLQLLSLLGIPEFWEGGLYYQWGRKDPIKMNEDVAASIDENIANVPYTFDTDWTAPADAWVDFKSNTTTKTINDPCPPGYKIPEYGIWDEADNSEDVSLLDRLASTVTSAYPYNTFEPYIYFPYVGSLSTAGQLNIVEPGSVPFTSTPEVVYSLGIEILTYEIASDRVKNMELEISLDTKHGKFWTNSASAFHFQYGTLSVDPTQLSSLVTSIKVKEAWVQHNNYEITYRTLPSWLGGGKIPNGFVDHWEPDFKKVDDSYFTVTDKLFLLGKLFTETNALTRLSCKINTEVSKAEGMNVRCVVE